MGSAPQIPPLGHNLWPDWAAEKTVFILDLLEERYTETFAHIVILCPTIRWNKTYHSRSWVWTDPQVFIVDPGDRLQEYLRAFYSVFAGESTLYIIDDCSASKALTKKKDMLSELAFSGRHADQSVWVLTQKYNSVLKDLREQTKWIAVFHCKDRDSFEDWPAGERYRPNERGKSCPLKSCYLKLAILSSYYALLSQLLISC